MDLAPGAAKEIAERVGGFVQENDATRQFQTRNASMELDKLALYRETAPISVDDVRALVPEAIPGSIWGFVDAVGERETGPALALLERLLDTTAEPVLVVVLHRRIRELLELGDRLGRRREPRDRRAGDGHQQRVPGRDARRAGPQLDDGRAGRGARRAASSSMR